ncbi:MAG: ABC transporter ATP-binding protein [Oscillospiraceae bacterium]|nr:ABC transporter ATP-binding protein [Oscillospiraceae bacterium]
MELRAERIRQEFLRASAANGFFTAVKEMNFHLPVASLTALTGRSGSGKSTLLHILSRLTAPSAGKVFFGEEDLYALPEDELARLRNRRIGFAPQRLMALSSLTVRENILMPALLYGESDEETVSRAEALTEYLGIRHLTGEYPQKLSGGELRRMTIARALVRKPQVLLADEPTGDLDEENTRAVLDLLRREADAGTAVLLASHEPDAARYADRLYEMREGELILRADATA